MRKAYRITWLCPECGEEHRLTSGLCRDGGPAESGALAQLHAGRRMPPDLAQRVNEASATCIHNEAGVWRRNRAGQPRPYICPLFIWLPWANDKPDEHGYPADEFRGRFRQAETEKQKRSDHA